MALSGSSGFLPGPALLSGVLLGAIPPFRDQHPPAPHDTPTRLVDSAWSTPGLPAGASGLGGVHTAPQRRPATRPPVRGPLTAHDGGGEARRARDERLAGSGIQTRASGRRSWVGGSGRRRHDSSGDATAEAATGSSTSRLRPATATGPTPRRAPRRRRRAPLGLVGAAHA